MNYQGYILAGGLSTRMGTDKGSKLLNDKPMISYAIELLSSYEMPITIISNRNEYETLGCRVIEDKLSPIGPLGGIYTALKDAGDDLALILPCDMPLLHHKVIISLLCQYNSSASINVLVNNDKLHPLIGIYHPKVLSNIQHQVDNLQYAVRKLLDIENTHYIHTDFAEEIFTNVNDQEEFTQIHNMLSK